MENVLKIINLTRFFVKFQKSLILVNLIQYFFFQFIQKSFKLLF